MARTKKTSAKDAPKELTEMEFFTLESHAAEKQKLELKQQIAGLQRDMLGKDIIIRRHEIESLIRKQQQLVTEVQSLEVKKLNNDKKKEQVISEISERLDLQDNPGWGYDPTTLLIK